MSSEAVDALVHPDSLGDTLDAINAALFEPLPLSEGERVGAAGWLVQRQGLPGSYAGMFAPTGYDYTFGALTFTGEPVDSRAGTGHLLSEEACYALFRLGIDSLEVREALKYARRGILSRLAGVEERGDWSGVYCCGTCSAALWRHLLASGRAEDQRRLEIGVAALRRHRDESGRWKRFPYFYTLLALAEMDLPAARDELRYAAPTAERALRRLIRAETGAEDKFHWRRRVLLQRALERC